MAFVQSTPLPTLSSSSATATQSATTCRLPNKSASMSMDINRSMSRRAALTTLAGGIAGVGLASLLGKTTRAANAAADNFDLKELKKDAEELKYDEELTDVGPDSREKNPTRVKKKEKEPEYRAEEKKALEADDKSYDTMVAKEEAEANRIREKFTKGK